MSPELAKIFDGKKFMWDGNVYETKEQAVKAGERYRQDSFDVRMREEEEKFFVYTRRVVKEVIATAP
jgi:hypothetical protein